MADANVFWKDDEIVVDMDGIPHFTGQKPKLMKEYRRRVIFPYNNVEGRPWQRRPTPSSTAKAS